jgi:hypothetical protein
MTGLEDQVRETAKMSKAKIPLPILIFAMALLFPSCTSDSNSPAKDALKSLRKIQAATQVGITRNEYRQLVMDAQADVNECEAKLPDGELKTRIVKIMKLYSKAESVWTEVIRQEDTLGAKDEELLETVWAIASKGVDEISELVD